MHQRQLCTNARLRPCSLEGVLLARATWPMLVPVIVKPDIMINEKVRYTCMMQDANCSVKQNSILVQNEHRSTQETDMCTISPTP